MGDDEAAVDRLCTQAENEMLTKRRPLLSHRERELVLAAREYRDANRALVVDCDCQVHKCEHQARYNTASKSLDSALRPYEGGGGAAVTSVDLHAEVAMLHRWRDAVTKEVARHPELPCGADEFSIEDVPALLAVLSGRIEHVDDYATERGADLPGGEDTRHG